MAKKQEKTVKERYMRNIRVLVGETINSYNENTPQEARHTGIVFRSSEMYPSFLIVDTIEDRALGVVVWTDNNTKFERRLERMGVMILKRQKNVHHGILPAPKEDCMFPTMYVVRIPEEEDVEA